VLRSLKWYFPSGFPTKTLYAALISNACYIILPTYPTYLIIITIFGKSKNCAAPDAENFSFLLSLHLSNIKISKSLQHSVLRTLNSWSSLSARNQIWYSIHNEVSIDICYEYPLLFDFSDSTSNLQVVISETESALSSAMCRSMESSILYTFRSKYKTRTNVVIQVTLQS
jgi:hypothetical protein